MLGPASQEVIEKIQKFSANHYHRLSVVIVRGEGTRVWDIEGREYIDMLSCYSALNVGHSHPRILKVLREQAGLLANVSNAVYTPVYAEFVERLAKFCFLDKVLPKKGGVGPLVPGFKWVPFGDAGALEKAITENTVAFIVEPIQGEGGINVPPEE